jgi:hypothetical protein
MIGSHVAKEKHKRESRRGEISPRAAWEKASKFGREKLILDLDGRQQSEINKFSLSYRRHERILMVVK